MGSIPIALGGRHLRQDTYPCITYRWKELLIWNHTHIYKLYSKDQKNIYLTNMVKKRYHQAVSRGEEPEYSEQVII